jgi:hypothetical protein
MGRDGHGFLKNKKTGSDTNGHEWTRIQRADGEQPEVGQESLGRPGRLGLIGGPIGPVR